MKLKEKFDLIIYDDIRSYPKYSKYEIIDIMNKCIKEQGKIIVYSIETVFNASKEISMHVRDNKIPIVEPRVITTRVDVNKDMPYVVYEYLKWSINIGRRVVIPVPDNVKLFNVTSYIYKYCHTLTRNIYYYSSNEKNSKAIEEFYKFKNCIIITMILIEFAESMKT